VLRLDPVDTVITQAPFPTGAADFVRWCRELSRAAGHVATQVENTATGPRHHLAEHNDPGEQTDESERQW
jgi:hypothetical protein